MLRCDIFERAPQASLAVVPPEKHMAPPVWSATRRRCEAAFLMLHYYSL